MHRIGKMIPFLPGIKKYRNYAVTRTFERKNQGSPNKDLFHYLVKFFSTSTGFINYC